ncbi:hypothetical protein [Tissierella sp.]
MKKELKKKCVEEIVRTFRKNELTFQESKDVLKEVELALEYLKENSTV